MAHAPTVWRISIMGYAIIALLLIALGILLRGGVKRTKAEHTEGEDHT